jgi:PAS domain S-box-containing protein
MDITVSSNGSDQTAVSLIFFQTLVDTIPNPLFHADSDGRFRFCNPAFAELFGHDPADIIGKTIADLVPSVVAGNTFLDQHPGRHIVPLKLWRKTGGLLEVEFHYATIPGPDGQVDGIAGMVIDITEIGKRQVAQFQQQKRNALEIVAGGIAHNLNNSIGVIVGNLETALQYEIPDASPARESVTDALNAGLRTKDLIRQLLIFARKSHEAIALLPLSILVKETLKTLHFQSIGVEYDITPDLEPVMADVSQIHQLLISLIDHAAQSMGRQGGRLQVTLKHVDITLEMARKLKLSGPGPFKALVVTHTDCQENEHQKPTAGETIECPQAWNPGTTLGLERVYSIVQYHNAAIEIERIPGNGSRVTVYFPVIRETGKE